MSNKNITGLDILGKLGSAIVLTCLVAGWFTLFAYFMSRWIREDSFVYFFLMIGWAALPFCLSFAISSLDDEKNEEEALRENPIPENTIIKSIGN
jgi:hypothetical protein